MKKRLLSLALCLVLVVGLFSGLTVNASAGKIDDLKKEIAEKLIKEKIEQFKEEFEIPDLDMDAILSSFGTAATSGDFGVNNCLHWEVSTGAFSGKTLTISGTGAMPDFDFPNGNLAPWWNYEALGMLTSFGNFKLEGELKKVVIKDGVTNVSNYALFFLPGRHADHAAGERDEHRPLWHRPVLQAQRDLPAQGRDRHRRFRSRRQQLHRRLAARRAADPRPRRV